MLKPNWQVWVPKLIDDSGVIISRYQYRYQVECQCDQQVSSAVIFFKTGDRAKSISPDATGKSEIENCKPGTLLKRPPNPMLGSEKHMRSSIADCIISIPCSAVVIRGGRSCSRS